MNALEFTESNKIAIIIALAVIAAAIMYQLWRRGSSGSSNSGLDSRAVMREFTDLRTELSGQATLRKIIAGSRDSEPSADGWLKHEEQVCERFARLRERLQPSKYFRSAKGYLASAHEANRSIKPFWVYILFVVMVVAESYAFNLLLADYIAWGSTPFQQGLAAWGLCIIFSIIFVGLAELAGRSQYVQSLAYYAFRIHQGPASKDKDLMPNHEISLDDNDADKLEPRAIRILNRSEKISERTHVGQEVKRICLALIVVSIAIIVTMIGIFEFRVNDLSRKETQEVRLREELLLEQSSPARDRTQTPIPKELRDTQAKAEERAAKEEDSDKNAAFYWAFAIFSILFLGVQVIGILLAYAYGFASDHGERAYLATKDFDHAGAYEEFHDRLRRDLDGSAQQTLNALQQLVTVEGNKFNLKNSWRAAIQSSNGRSFGAFLARRASTQARLANSETAAATGATSTTLVSSPNASDNAANANAGKVFYSAVGNDGKLVQGLIGLEELKMKVLRDRLDAEKVTITSQAGGESMTLHEFLTRSA